MAKISLASYIMKICDTDGNIYDVHQIPDGQNHIHINQIFSEYFHARLNIFVDNTRDQKLLSVQTYNNYREPENGNRIIYQYHAGRLETGSYGYSSTIRDVETSNIILEKLPTYAETLPFFYSFYVPHEGDGCVCVFQRFKNFGYKSVFEEDFKAYFRERLPNVRFTINPLLPEEYVTRFVDEGRILKLRLIKHNLPEDLADAVLDNRNGADDSSAELVISARARGDLGVNPTIRERIWGVIRHQTSLQDAFEVQDFQYDNIKIEVKMGRTTKTLNIGDLENLTGYYDITDEVVINNGHPEYNSILGISKEYAEHFLRAQRLID